MENNGRRFSSTYPQTHLPLFCPHQRLVGKTVIKAGQWKESAATQWVFMKSDMASGLAGSQKEDLQY